MSPKKEITKFHLTNCVIKLSTKSSFTCRTNTWPRTNTFSARFDANPKATSQLNWWHHSRKWKSWHVTGKWSDMLFASLPNSKFLLKDTELSAATICPRPCVSHECWHQLLQFESRKNTAPLTRSLPCSVPMVSSLWSDFSEKAKM